MKNLWHKRIDNWPKVRWVIVQGHALVLMHRVPCALAVEPTVLATTVYHLELIVLVYYFLSANFAAVYSKAFPAFP